MSCLFCRIVSGELPTDVVLETERALVFRDVAPQAPTHVLAVPKDHHPDMASLVDADPSYAGEVMAAAVAAARAEGVADDGYRLVVNTGRDGGQTVGHLHVHVLGGRGLSWPPG